MARGTERLAADTFKIESLGRKLRLGENVRIPAHQRTDFWGEGVVRCPSRTGILVSPNHVIGKSELPALFVVRCADLACGVTWQ